MVNHEKMVKMWDLCMMIEGKSGALEMEETLIDESTVTLWMKRLACDCVRNKH